ncbi:carotenoid oxygenase family protein [Leptolyngbya sp. 'hensonii']|uniref:carotenoid oxygenase family protein n=1 Tax=Leptolyngbya sp. 'hensonii' TaxID=1922337 RepID=UPI0015C577D8|nr:carotenoid oxygenase family protein [Leptolyngbya sp. 'hensonii']
MSTLKSFIPKSLAEIRVKDKEKYRAAAEKRRREHDDLCLNVQICVWTADEPLLHEWQNRVPQDWQETITLPEGWLFCLRLQSEAADQSALLESLPDSLRDRLPQDLQLPTDLQGYVFNIAPLPPSSEAFPADDRIVLNGDGMIYRLGFEAGQAILKTRITKTVCYYADQLMQRIPKSWPNRLFRWWTSFRDGGIVRTSLPMGSRNQLNTAFLAVRDHLLVTFDGGRPHEVDPDSLEILSPIGTIHQWKPLLLFMKNVPRLFRYIFQPYSTAAHPVFDLSPSASGESQSSPDPADFYIANFSAGLGLINAVTKLRRWFRQRGIYLGSWGSYTHLVRCRFNHEIEHWKLLVEERSRFSEQPRCHPVVLEQAAHQMAISRNYIILPDVSFKMELSEVFAPFVYLIRKLFKNFPRLVPPQPYTTLYIIDRRKLGQGGSADEPKAITVKKAVIPYELAHFAIDYDDTDDQITLHVGHTDGWDVTEWIRQGDRRWDDHSPMPRDLWGMQTSTTDLGSLGRYVIDAQTGNIVKSAILSDADRNTWSISVCSHHELCRDRPSVSEEKVKTIYWMSWGFTRQLIPQRIYNAYDELRENRLVAFDDLPQADQPMSLLRVDTQAMEITDYFQFRLGCFARSPQFVPSALPPAAGQDPTTHGYIVCVVLDDDIKDLADPVTQEPKPNDEFWVFHADDFKNKPIYRLEHPEVTMEQTIHSTWIQSIQPSNAVDRQARRRQTLAEDYDDVLSGKWKTKQLFQGQGTVNVYDLFVQQTPERDLPDQIQLR